MATVDPPAVVAETKPAEDSLADKAAALEISDGPAKDTAPTAAEPTEKPATTETAAPAPAVNEPKVEEIPSGPTLTPFPYPLPTAKPAPAPILTAEQQTKYDSLLAAVKEWKTIALTTAAHTEKEPVTDADRLWLTRECLLRYLAATKWDVKAAEQRLLATLTWRREYGLLRFTHDYISEENATGKQVILGYDNEGRPCLYLNPSKQNTEKTPRQLQHLFYNMERVIDIMPPGQTTLALLINFSDTKRGQGASLAQGRETLYILQNHYPERLGRALITELPWYISAFFKLITPLIDPVTRPKLKFNEPIVNHVPVEQLIKTFGGDVDFEYKHDIYWPALDKLCSQRRREYRTRWVKGGKQIGEGELYLRGGDAKSLSGEHNGTDFKEGDAKWVAEAEVEESFSG